MKEEKACECGCHHKGKHVYMVIGTVAFVYGLMSYFMTVQMWPSYTAWMVGGILLVVIGWLKKWFFMKKSM